MRIEIAEIENRNIYRVWHDGVILIERTPTPLVTAARILFFERGADPNEMLEMVRRETPDRVDMWGRLESLALASGASPDSEIGVEPTGKPASSSNASREAAGAAGPSEGRVVAVLDEHRRVVADRGSIQWILQVRGPIGSWSNRSYCSTKEALIRCCCGSTPELDALPDRIGDRIPPTIDMQDAAE